MANLGPSLLATELKYRLEWLETAVLSILAARWVTWPCSVGLAKRLDQTQVHMIAILINYKHNIGVSNEIYYNHRNLLAGKHAATNRWSVKWAAAVLAWHHHCVNPLDTCMWHRSILKHHGPAWLALQRLEHSSGSKTKTRTRDSSGNVPARWSEQLDHALDLALNWRTLRNSGLYV